jgi:hypothetical protein
VGHIGEIRDRAVPRRVGIDESTNATDGMACLTEAVPIRSYLAIAQQEQTERFEQPCLALGGRVSLLDRAMCASKLQPNRLIVDHGLSKPHISRAIGTEERAQQVFCGIQCSIDVAIRVARFAGVRLFGVHNEYAARPGAIANSPVKVRLNARFDQSDDGTLVSMSGVSVMHEMGMQQFNARKVGA